jgi:hypothetical protein
VQGRRSGEIIEEEDEEEDVEEVEEFSPIKFGEQIEEVMLEQSPEKEAP